MLLFLYFSLLCSFAKVVCLWQHFRFERVGQVWHFCFIIHAFDFQCLFTRYQTTFSQVNVRGCSSRLLLTRNLSDWRAPASAFLPQSPAPCGVQRPARPSAWSLPLTRDWIRLETVLLPMDRTASLGLQTVCFGVPWCSSFLPELWLHLLDCRVFASHLYSGFGFPWVFLCDDYFISPEDLIDG